MNHYQERFKSYMEEKGLHVTRQRLSIAGLLQAMPGHHTAEDLHDSLRAAEPGIGQSTVYRTLKLLAEAGLALELNPGGGVARVEAAPVAESHEHLVCRNCGAIVEVKSRVLSSLQDRLAEEHGFVLEKQAHCLLGLCQSCLAGANDS